MCTLKNKKAVLFDLDGTLIDSEWFYYKAWRAVLEEYGFALHSDIWLNDVAGKTDIQAFDMLNSKYGVEIDQAELFERVRKRIARQHDEEPIPLMPGAADLIHFLHQRQITMAVVTSSKREVASYHLERNGIREFFKALVTRTEVKHTKPHPEPYLLCVQQLDLAVEDCLAIEDSLTGTTAAKAAGLACFGVQTHESIRKVLKVDRTFDNLHEVREFLEK